MCSTAKDIWEKLFNCVKQRWKRGKQIVCCTIEVWQHQNEAKWIYVRFWWEGQQHNNWTGCLRKLPSEWDVKTIVMREDLNKLEPHDLFADLKACVWIGNKNWWWSNSKLNKALAATSIEPSVSKEKSAEQLSNNAMSLFVRNLANFSRRTKAISKTIAGETITRKSPLMRIMIASTVENVVIHKWPSQTKRGWEKANWRRRKISW